jgi:hypothetical protein
MTSQRARRNSIDVPCVLDLAQLPETLHAHVELCGIDIAPGDTVLIHEAPSHIAFGEHRVVNRRATVLRAGRLHSWWVRLTSWFQFSTLWEVGFSPGPLPATIRRRNP